MQHGANLSSFMHFELDLAELNKTILPTRYESIDHILGVTDREKSLLPRETLK